MKTSVCAIATILLHFDYGIHALRVSTATIQHPGPPSFARARPEQHVLMSRSDALSSRESLSIYTIDVAVGTPSQNLSLILAPEFTGTLIPLWDPYICTLDPEACRDFGTFNGSSSSTFKQVVSAPTPGYLEDIVGPLMYFEDTFVIGNRSFGGSTMLAFQPTHGDGTLYTPAGFLGLGPSFKDEEGYIHGSLLDEMLLRNFSRTRSYSIWLADDTQDGEIAFGSLDTTRYRGDLVALPALKPCGVGLDSLTYHLNGGMAAFTKVGGSSLMALISGLAGDAIYVPTTITNRIGKELNISNNEGFDCNLIPSEASLTFTFQTSYGPVIEVPLSSITGSLEKGLCFFHNTLEANMVILGAPFLRSAYTVFNWDADQIAIAPSAARSSGSDVIPITGPYIPGAAVISPNGTYTCPAPIPGRSLPAVCNSTVRPDPPSTPPPIPVDPCLINPDNCPTADPCFVDPYNCTGGIPGYPSLSPRMTRQLLLTAFVVMSIVVFLTPCIMLVVFEVGGAIGYEMASIFKFPTSPEM